MSVDTVSPDRPSARWPGALLIVTAALAMLAMAHHPTGSGGDPASMVGSIAAIGATARWVHALLIVLMLLQGWLLLEILLTSAGGRLNRLGMIAWSVGTLLMTGAALLSGFVAPAVAEQALGGDAGAMGRARDLLAFGHLLNQVLAQAGVACWMAALAAWSLRLPARATLSGDRWLMVLAVYGVAVGLLTLAALASGQLRLDIHGMGLTLALLSIWQIGIGGLTLTGRLKHG